MINKNEALGFTIGSALTFLLVETFIPQTSLAGHIQALAGSLVGGALGVGLSRKVFAN